MMSTPAIQDTKTLQLHQDQDPLRNQPPPSASTTTTPLTLQSFLNQNIRTTLLLETHLLTLTFLTGLQDATTWPTYTCFASNQTGNTILLALAPAHLPSSTSTSTTGTPGHPRTYPQHAYSIPNTATSLTCFIAGAFTHGQLGNYLGVRRRGWLLLSNALQTILVLVAAGVQLVSASRRDGLPACLVIGCLAFASGGQVAMARSLGVTEITTAMATAAFVDVGIDAGLGAGVSRNRGRNRRVMFLVMLVVGCLVGGFLERGVGGGVVLVLCAVGKGVVCLGFLFNRGDEREEEDENENEKEMRLEV